MSYVFSIHLIVRITSASSYAFFKTKIYLVQVIIFYQLLSVVFPFFNFHANLPEGGTWFIHRGRSHTCCFTTRVGGNMSRRNITNIPLVIFSCSYSGKYISNCFAIVINYCFIPALPCYNQSRNSFLDSRQWVGNIVNLIPCENKGNRAHMVSVSCI